MILIIKAELGVLNQGLTAFKYIFSYKCTCSALADSSLLPCAAAIQGLSVIYPKDWLFVVFVLVLLCSKSKGKVQP